MKPAFGGGWKNVNKIHSQEELLRHYDESGSLTMMLQEFIAWDTYVRVPTIGRRHARAIRYDPAPGGLGGYDQDYDALPSALRDTAEELSLRFNVALGYDMNALEFAVKDGRFYGIDLTNYTPDLDYRSLKDAHFPWAVERMATRSRSRRRSRASERRHRRPSGSRCCCSRGDRGRSGPHGRRRRAGREHGRGGCARRLRVRRARRCYFAANLGFAVVHPIDERSPLHGLDEPQLRASQAEVLILVSGMDETSSQTVHARTSYRAEEVVWNARFADMFLRGDLGLLGVDMRRLHDVEPA